MATNQTPRLILAMSVSFDGFVAHRDGVLDWHANRDDGRPKHDDRRHRANLELLGQVGHIVLGRQAYEDMVEAWRPSTSPMGVLMNTLPKTVFSSTLSDVEWSNARVCAGPVEVEIPKLREQPGKDIVCFGGGRFANALARHRLIDEYRLTVQPVALGDGIPLLHGLPEPQRLDLHSSTVYADGAVTQTYVPA